VDLTPQTIEFHKYLLPDNLTAEMIKTAPPEFMQTVFDYMLQRLVKDSKCSTVDFPVHPTDRPLSLACTQDIEHLPLPMVRAELANPWIRTDFHRQVLTILTFYKMWQVHGEVLRDMEEWGWPRDLNARGFTVFYPQPRGTEVLFRECGVRLHSSDRECSQQQLRSMPPREVAALFGEPEARGAHLQISLSAREQRQVSEILEFPFLLVTAFLVACKAGSARSASPPNNRSHLNTKASLSPRDTRGAGDTRGERNSRGTRNASPPRKGKAVSDGPTSPSRVLSKIYRMKELLRGITSHADKGTTVKAEAPAVAVGDAGHPLSGTALGNLYLAMASESCVNLRFFAIMEEVRSILDMKSVGQVLMGLTEGVLHREPRLESAPLEVMLRATLAAMPQGDRALIGWDDKEARMREIDDVDVRVQLRLLGYE
jgi:hypothetical protein